MVNQFHRTVIENARKAEKLVEDAIIAIALDTKGPEVRTGTILNDEVLIFIFYLRKYTHSLLDLLRDWR